MTFTDDDLKRLKEYYEDPKRGDTPMKWRALLSRLEAAEEVIKEFKLDPVPVGVVERWRKSAGK